MYYIFIDIMTEELNRRFKGGNTRSPNDRIVQSFHALTVCDTWTSTANSEAEEAVHILCDLYECYVQLGA